MPPADHTPSLVSVQYPVPDFNIRTVGDRKMIWDGIRKKFIPLTSEEWVRQNFLQYLIRVKNYPGSLMAIEKEIHLGERKKRCDIVVYQASVPWMIVECKEPHVVIDQKTMKQILAYNMAIPAPYLVLTNGDVTYGIHRTGLSWDYITDLPEYG
jgi:hypothetical protein